MRKYRVVVGLSGGVDSAVSAWLLKQQGHEVIGVFMKNWEGDDDGDYCSSRQDWLDAVSVADVIGIDIEHVNFSAEYKDRVFSEFLKEYEAGRTPNPDIFCNAEIKFKAFLEYALKIGAEKIATGHYARKRALRIADGRWLHEDEVGNSGEEEVQYQLLRGIDPAKDQSYFLYRLTQAQLARAMFPVGHLRKSEVRRLAAEIGLPNARKKDSTGICFIGERPFREFLQRYIHGEPGPIVDEQGRKIGCHVGLSFYTLGQRQGLGIGGVRGRDKDEHGIHAPWFVAHKDVERNTLWAVQGHDHPWLRSNWLRAENAHWISGGAPSGPCVAKVRYRQKDAPCLLVQQPQDSSLFEVRFSDPQWAVAPGQSVVLYDGEICLGGGIIASYEAGELLRPKLVET